MALKKLSFRDDTEARADTWNPASDNVNQVRERQQPSLEQHQRGLNKMKPSRSNTPPPPGVVVDQKKMNDGKIMKTLKDQAGKLFKQIFDGSKMVYDSRGATARDKRKLKLAMIVSKASKEEWINAQERVIERLMEEKGMDWDAAYDHVAKNADLVDVELSGMYNEDNPAIER
jgi:hypothetical protein